MLRTQACVRMRSPLQIWRCSSTMDHPSNRSSTGTAVLSWSYQGCSFRRNEVGVHRAHCSSFLYQSGCLMASNGKIWLESEKSSTLHPGSGKFLKTIAVSGIVAVSELSPTQIASQSTLIVVEAIRLKWWIANSITTRTSRTVLCKISHSPNFHSWMVPTNEGGGRKGGGRANKKVEVRAFVTTRVPD